MAPAFRIVPVIRAQSTTTQGKLKVQIHDASFELLPFIIANALLGFTKMQRLPRMDCLRLGIRRRGSTSKVVHSAVLCLTYQPPSGATTHLRGAEVSAFDFYFEARFIIEDLGLNLHHVRAVNRWAR
jgi:hypothetical protein